MPKEASIEAEIRRINQEIDQKKRDKIFLLTDLFHEASVRRLIFEKGKELEEAIINPFKLFCFKTKPFQDAESEFDAIFISSEGRFLGEAEGEIVVFPEITLEETSTEKN